MQPYLYKATSDNIAPNAAFDRIRSVIHEYLSYNDNLNITCLPIYHLDPNQRIRVVDSVAGVNGDYVIKTISVPLTANGTMSITAQKALERT